MCIYMYWVVNIHIKRWTSCNYLPLYFWAICSARARLLPPARWATAATNSFQEGGPKRVVSYALCSHCTKTSVRQPLTSPGWSAWIVLSKPGFSLRASPILLQLCATSRSSPFTSVRSSTPAKVTKYNTHTCHSKSIHFCPPSHP